MTPCTVQSLNRNWMLLAWNDMRAEFGQQRWCLIPSTTPLIMRRLVLS